MLITLLRLANLGKENSWLHVEIKGIDRELVNRQYEIDISFCYQVTITYEDTLKGYPNKILIMGS